MVEQTHMNELTRIRTYMLCKRSNGSVWSSITDANKSTITNDDHTGSEVSETSTGKKDMSWPPLTVCLHSLLCALFLHSIQWQWQEKKNFCCEKQDTWIEGLQLLSSRVLSMYLKDTNMWCCLVLCKSIGDFYQPTGCGQLGPTKFINADNRKQ